MELVRELHDLSPKSVGVPHLLGGGAAGHKHPHGSWGHHLEASPLKIHRNFDGPGKW